MQISYKVLNSQSFNETLKVLASAKIQDFQAGYNLARLVKQVGKALEEALQTYINWSTELFVTDDKGQFVMAETPNPITPYKVKEGKEEEFFKKLTEFLETTIEIKSYPIKPADLIGISLSAKDIAALEPILDLTSYVQPESPQPETPLQA